MRMCNYGIRIVERHHWQITPYYQHHHHPRRQICLPLLQTLDEIATKHMYDNIISMKLDIEGFETNVLLDLGGKDFLKRVKRFARSRH